MTDSSAVAFHSCDYAREFALDEISGCGPTARAARRREYGKAGEGDSAPSAGREQANRIGKARSLDGREADGSLSSIKPARSAARTGRIIDERKPGERSGLIEPRGKTRPSEPRDERTSESGSERTIPADREGGTLTRYLIEEYKNE